MKKQITKKQLILSVAAWSIFILVYWLAFYELYTLCKFGRFKNDVSIILGCLAFFAVFFIILIIKAVKKLAVLAEQGEQEHKDYSRTKTKWNCVVLISVALITCFYGVKIYHDAVKYNGKLAWLLEDLKNKKTVKLQHHDVYKSGIEGILSDINEKVHMPKKLYIATSFSLKFDSDGKITAFDTFLYGKNTEGKLETYLISYDSSKSDNITVRLNGNANPNYSKDKLLKPLLDTMKVIPLEKTVSKWPEKKFGILYYGKRSLGYNTDGVIYIDSKGNTSFPGMASSEIVGYTVSVYVPGKENQYVPVRYNLTDGSASAKISESSKDSGDKKLFDEPDSSSGQFYLSKKVGYRLEVTAAAAGSRSYSLNRTTDGGDTWKVINEDPFAGEIGTASGITFLNDKLGFLGLAHSGGSRGELYRTEDGGKSYTKVDFPEVKVTLNGGQTYNPFDLPGMPYKKNGSLNVLVGQGSDGDYKGGVKALYESKDKGKTWQYIKEVTKK